MRRRKIWAAIGVVGLVGGVAVAFATLASARDHRARATLVAADDTEMGKVSFKSVGGHTEVRVTLTGMPAGAAVDAFHGFHIHANDNPANGQGCVADPALAASTWFVSADGHWKDGTQSHGAHVGDLATVYVNPDGTAEARFSIDRVRLADLDGKVVIFHAQPDNYGNVPTGAAADQYTPNSADATTKTQNTGNAGDRIGCGVIDAR